MLPALALALCLSAKEERLDHQGAVGLIAAVSGLRKDSSNGFENTWRGGLDLGASINIGWRSNEILVVANVSMGEVLTRYYVDGQVWAGLRGYFGDRWKTFYDLDVGFNWDGRFTVGPRIGVGLQYEVSPVFGVFANLAAQLGFGQELMFKGIFAVGIQLRSYLLE